MQTPGVIKAGVYCRISVSEPGRDKVGAQELTCRQLAASQGYEVVRVYVDDGISASTGAARPGWDQMLEDVAADRLDVLLAVEESRFARTMPAKIELQVACGIAGVKWHTPVEGLVDPASADGEMLSMLRTVLARHEVKRKSERQLRANAGRRASGLPVGGPRIFGFEMDRITHRSDEAAELVWAYKSIADGGSVYNIARSWIDRGVKTASNYHKKPDKLNDKWSYQSVRQVLLNPRNAAIYTFRGEELPVQAQWEPIVSRDLFETVKALLTDPSRRITDQREPKWLLAGIATCGVCGGYMRSSQGSSRGKSWPVYRCTAKHSLPDDERRHSAIMANVLDELARSAVAAAFIFGSSADTEVKDPDVAEARRLRARQSEIAQELDAAVEQVVRSKSPSAKAAAQRIFDALELEDITVRGQLADIERQSAQASLLARTEQALLSRGAVNMQKAADRKVALEEAFDALPLAKRRTLVKEFLDVAVNPGRGTERVEITHKRVPTLSAVDELADA